MCMHAATNECIHQFLFDSTLLRTNRLHLMIVRLAVTLQRRLYRFLDQTIRTYLKSEWVNNHHLILHTQFYNLEYCGSVLIRFILTEETASHVMDDTKHQCHVIHSSDRFFIRLWKQASCEPTCGVHARSKVSDESRSICESVRFIRRLNVYYILYLVLFILYLVLFQL